MNQIASSENASTDAATIDDRAGSASFVLTSHEFEHSGANLKLLRPALREGDEVIVLTASEPVRPPEASWFRVVSIPGASDFTLRSHIPAVCRNEWVVLLEDHALAWSLRLSNLEVAIVTLVSISAFSAYRWLALTGNIAVPEAPLAALSIAALHRRRYELSGAAFGLMRTLRVLPLVGVLAFLVIPVGWPQKARAIAAGVAAFVALHLVNAAISGAYFVSFVKATLGQIPTSRCSPTRAAD